MILLISCIAVFQGASGEKGDKGESVSAYVTLTLFTFVLHIMVVRRNSGFM